MESSQSKDNRSTIVLFSIVASIVFGMFLCGGYVFLANKFCPIDIGQPSLNSVLSELLLEYRKYSEQQRSEWRKQDGNENYDYVEITPAPLDIDQPPKQQTDRHDQGDTKHNEAHSWIGKFFCEAKAADIALVFFTYGLMVVTIFLVWATLKLWKAGEELAERQIRDTEILQRAYISVEPRGVHAHEAAWRQTLQAERGNCANTETVSRKIQSELMNSTYPIGKKISRKYARHHRYGNDAT